MPGAGCSLLCTRHINKYQQILFIRIAQDETDRKCRERPRARSPPQKTEGSKKGAPYEGDKTPQYPVGPWRMGAGAGCGPAAGRVRRCSGPRRARKIRRSCRPKLRQQPTHPRRGGAGRPDRPHHRPVHAGKERFGRVGGGRGAVHFRPCAAAGMRQPGCCKPEQGACRHLCGGFPGI